MALASTVQLHPSQVTDPDYDYAEDLSSPVKESLAFAWDGGDYGEIVLLENGEYAYLPTEKTEPVIIEAVSLIELLKAILQSKSEGILSLEDSDIEKLFGMAFNSVYNL